MHESEDGQNNQGNTLKSFHFFFYSECPIMLICKCIFRIILIFVLKLCCLRVLCIYPYIRKYVFGYFFMLECVCVCMFMSAHWKSILKEKHSSHSLYTCVYTSTNATIGCILCQLSKLTIVCTSRNHWGYRDMISSNVCYHQIYTHLHIQKYII